MPTTKKVRIPEVAQDANIVRAFDAIRAKFKPITTLFQYYDGFQPLKYSTQRLADAFKDINAYFAENWCVVVVDSVTDRLQFKGWDTGNTKENEILADLFKNLRLAEDADEVHLSASITGEAYFIAWKEGAEIEGYFNDPRLCQMFYKPDSPKEKDFAAKLWVDETANKTYINLYYPDKIEHWSAPNLLKNLQNSKSFVLDDTETNSFAEIPVFHFRVNKRKNQGDLTPSILSLQDAINKMLSDMMTSAEFSALVQRVIITNSEVKTLRNKAGVNWVIPDAESKVQELGGKADVLDSFIKSINHFSNSIAVQSKTPKHYFFDQGTGSSGNLSGDALIALESPLNKKTEKRKEIMSPIWVEIGNFFLELSGKSENPNLVPVWGKVESVQPRATAEIREINSRAGLALETSLRWEGKTEEEIAQVMKDKEEEAERNSGLAKNALDKLRANDAATNADGTNQSDQSNE